MKAFDFFLILTEYFTVDKKHGLPWTTEQFKLMTQFLTMSKPNVRPRLMLHTITMLGKDMS